MTGEIIPITVAFGDGIGHETMHTVLMILREARARIRIEMIEIGEDLYRRKYNYGISESALESLFRTKALLKGPVIKPIDQKNGDFSDGICRALSLYVNLRRIVSYSPFIQSDYPKLDLVTIQQNIDNIEYHQTHNTYEFIKRMNRLDSEKLMRFAFGYAKQNQRKKISCLYDINNIFPKIFDEISREHKDIDSSKYLIKQVIGEIVTDPELFDVIIAPSPYGDIISNIATALTSSKFLESSANIGFNYAMFEPVHGVAKDIEAKDIANPSALINSAIMMLNYIGQRDIAALIENAWKKTVEDGIHTPDMGSNNDEKKMVGTMGFADAVISRFGQEPSILKKAEQHCGSNIKIDDKTTYRVRDKAVKKLVGIDIFIDISISSADEIAAKINKIDIKDLFLESIYSNGTKLWPSNQPAMVVSDNWCCRFLARMDEIKKSYGEMETIPISQESITKLLLALTEHKIDFVKIENLLEFDGAPGFST